jgi:predicted component of type VI protein secretion system
MGPPPPCCSPRTTEPSDPAEPWGLAITPPGLPRLPHHARADASRWLHRGAAEVSFAIPAMARPLIPAQPSRGPLERQCPIRVVSVHLLRVLFLDREGHISAQPHLMARSEALILAANQQRVARASGSGAGALRRRTGSVAPPSPGGFLRRARARCSDA